MTIGFTDDSLAGIIANILSDVAHGWIYLWFMIVLWLELVICDINFSFNCFLLSLLMSKLCNLIFKNFTVSTLTMLDASSTNFLSIKPNLKSLLSTEVGDWTFD